MRLGNSPYGGGGKKKKVGSQAFSCWDLPLLPNDTEVKAASETMNPVTEEPEADRKQLFSTASVISW